MSHRRKQHIIIRHFRVFRRGVKRLTRRKIVRWFRRNLKGHPFVLGFIVLVWLNLFLKQNNLQNKNILAGLKFHILLLLAWLILVAISNALKDKIKAKWYLKKRFVFFILIIFQPLGIILLWSGSKFRKTTKLLFTLIFSVLFIVSFLYYSKEYNKMQRMSSLDRIIELITKAKQKVFLKTYSPGTSKSLNFSVLDEASKTSLAVSEIFGRSAPSVVSIKVMDKNGKEFGWGSGFIISQDGFIVTNFHVLASAYKAQVKIGEQLFDDVYFVKGIPEMDLAVIKINAENLPVLPIGDSDNLMNGQLIVVLGNPWGFERSVSSGLISSLRAKGNLRIIQMSAPVSMGSSGGPVLNEYGEVIGVTTVASVFMAQNLNFAVPINYLKDMLKK